MAVRKIGKSEDAYEKPKTLRQYLQDGNGKCPDRSFVKTIFIPGKYPLFTLVSDHNFKVAIQQNSELGDLLKQSLDDWSRAGEAIIIHPDKENPGKFELSISDETEADWEEKEWGYVITGFGTKKKNPLPSKTPKKASSLSEKTKQAILDA